MKNSRLFFFKLFCSFILCGFILASNAFAKTPPQQLIKKRLNSIASQKTKSLNLTEILLLISKDWNPSLIEHPLRNEINQLVASVKSQLKPETTAQETVDILLWLLWLR